jgi:phage terminase large subunit
MRDYETRVNAFYGGAGSGKSYFVMQKIVLKALDSQRKVLIVRKVGATLKESVWSLTLELIHTGGLAPTVKQINKSDLTIEFLNGSVLLFKGLDDSEKIKSINGITDIVIEEATEITLDDFTQLNLRLRSKKPNNQIHLMFNPVSKANWVYKYFFETKADNCVIVQTTYRDNPHLPKEYVNSLHALENKNPAYYKIYVRGEFATLDKLVFPVIHKRIISEDELTDAWFWVGMDFGYTNDPTAITWGYYNPVQNDLYITGEYDKIGMTNDVIAETLVSLGLGKEKIVADSAEPKSITELRNLGIKRIIASVKGADSVKNGIDRMQRCNIIIDERCTKTIEEFENYTWQKDKKTGEYINQPVDSYNHHIDSIRYGIQTVINKKRGKTAEYQSIL